MNKCLKASAVVSSIILSSIVGISSAHAGSIFLTGHDILSHTNQNNYDDVVLNYLRGAGLAGEIAAADYNIGLVSSGSLSGFGTVTTHSASFASGTDFSNYLSGIDVLVVSEDQAGFLSTYNSIFTSWFNAGGDLWADTSNGTTGYYNWLPAGVAADGPGISHSTGFSATTAGAAIGITSTMITGFPTHSRFTSWAPAFTVLETHSNYTNSAVSIGIQSATITGGGITTQVPEPSTLAIFALGIMGLASRRFKKQ